MSQQEVMAAGRIRLAAHRPQGGRCATLTGRPPAQRPARVGHHTGANTSLGHEKGRWSQPISRVLSWTVIHLGRASPHASSDLPGARDAGHAIAPYLVLLRVGFTMPRLLPRARCALTAPFHPYQRRTLRRYIFCGTFRRLAPPRRYLAPCPVEPGLSSASNKAGSDCLADSTIEDTT
jgi:hypothetical protein